MLSNLVTSLFLGLGCGAWIYAKVRRGSPGKTALLVAAVAGIVIVIFMDIVLGIFIHKK
jgi:hypothetical protein